MRRWLHKWGYTLGVLACISTILFAALYTRQDELRALGAQSASQSVDQTLADAQAPAWTAPAQGEISQRFIWAQRDAQTLFWHAAPYVCYQLKAGDSIYAMCCSVVLSVQDGDILLQSEQDHRIIYSGDFRTQIYHGVTVAPGQTIARMLADGELRVTIRKDGAYIDPLALLSP